MSRFINSFKERVLMKSFRIFLLFCLCLFSGRTAAQETQKEIPVKIKMTFDDKTVIVRMKDNDAVRQLIRMLPASFEFIDFAGKEKITEFPKPVSFETAPRGMIASAGKMFIYAPWGNLGFFYKDHSMSPDENLIELGEVEKGLVQLSSQKGGFAATMEVMKENKEE